MNLKRYARLWRVFAINSLIREMEFKGNFIVSIFVEILWTMVTVFALEILFYQTQTIADWSKGEVFLLYGIYRFYSSICAIIIRRNMYRFPDMVNSGEFDFILTKPVSSLFMSATRMVMLDRFSDLTISVGVIAYGFLLIGQGISIEQLIIILALAVPIVLIRISFEVLIALPVFWLEKLENTQELVYALSTPARFPRETFSRSFSLLFTFVFPVMFLGAIPTEVVLGRSSLWWVVVSWGAALIMVFVLSRVFRHAVSHYASASS